MTIDGDIWQYQPVSTPAKAFQVTKGTRVLIGGMAEGNIPVENLTKYTVEAACKLLPYL